jgi:tetratricopeptide (TPR) repeat protein
MRECTNVEKMNFIIAQTMMKYCRNDKALYAKARHICEASRLIEARVKERSSYRKVLRDAAEMAVRSGARPTALRYFRHCLVLLQPDCWNDRLPDVDYEETRHLHISTAEILWYQGHNEEAMNLLSEVFQHGKTAAGNARAWILKSKIYAQTGDHNRAMDSLLASLEELGVRFRQAKSYEQCDVAFHRLEHRLKSINFESEIQNPVSEDKNVVAIGNVLAEAMAVAFWGDAVIFLQMTIEMINLHLFSGRFTQIGLGCSHLAMVAYSRYKDPELGARMSDLAFLLYDRYADVWSRGAGLTMQTSMVEHLRVPLRTSLPTLENAVEAAFAGTDPHPMLLSFASMAMARLYLGQDMSELESFCTETPEELDDWVHDTRGGAILVAVKQVARALQGKTSWHLPAYVLSDEYHKSDEFMEHLEKHATRADRPRNIYWGLGMIALYVYGHHEKAIEVGSSMMESVDRLWSMRVSYLIYFYLSLSILTQHFDDPSHSQLDSRMEDVLKYKAEIDFARSACDANYGMWSLLLEALLCELREEFNPAVLAYEVSHMEAEPQNKQE